MSAAGAVMRRAADGDHRAVFSRDVEIAADLGEVPLVDQRPDFGGGIERMTDFERPYAGGELFDELVGNALLNEEPAGGCATFAIERIDHEDDRIQRAIEFGVVEYDHRIFAAKFEMHPFQGRRALRHDRRTGGAFADKSNRLDRWVFRQRLAGFFAETMPCI